MSATPAGDGIVASTLTLCYDCHNIVLQAAYSHFLNTDEVQSFDILLSQNTVVVLQSIHFSQLPT